LEVSEVDGVWVALLWPTIAGGAKVVVVEWAVALVVDTEVAGDRGTAAVVVTAAERDVPEAAVAGDAEDKR